MLVESVAMIEVQYRYIDGCHIFTSEDVYGLYVASKSPEKAYRDVQPSIEKLMRLNHGLDIEVTPAQTYSEFVKAPTDEPEIPHPAIINESRKFLLRRAA